MPTLTQDAPASVPVYLEQPGCIPKTGLAYTDVTVSLQKQGGSFTTKIITSGDWSELGGGWYLLSLSNSDTNTLGDLLIRVNASGVNTQIVACSVVATITPPSPVAITIPQVILYGYLYDTFGNPLQNASVQATVLATPTIMHVSTEGLAVSTDLLVVKSDANGYWQMSLIPSSQVDISIPASGYRRSITVPSSASNLFDVP